MKALAAVLVLALPPSVHPWPIGAGPRYTPPPRPAAVVAGAPIGGLRCAAVESSYRAHVELFAERKVVIVPARLGVASSGCVYPVHTTAPDGIVQVARGRRVTLADLFRVWGQPLGEHRLVSFTSRSPLRVYVAGRLVRGPAARVPLTPHAQIVVELGGYVPPHPFFLFSGGQP